MTTPPTKTRKAKPTHENEAFVSNDAEQGAIGSVFRLDPKGYGNLFEILSPEMFWRPAHRALWGWMSEIHAKGQIVDMVTLRHLGGEEMEAAGGLDYVYPLAEMVPSPAHASHYATIVRTCYCRRVIRDGLGGLAERLAEAEDPAVVLGSILDVAKNAHLPQRFAFDMADVEMPPSPKTFTSGYPALDDYCTGKGLAAGQVTVVCAGTGVGKTMLMCDMTRRMCLEGAERIAFVTLADLDRKELKRRIVKQISGHWTPPSSLEGLAEWDAALRCFRVWDIVCYDPQDQEGAGDVESLSAWLIGENQRRPWTAVIHDYAQETISSRRDFRTEYDQAAHVSRVIRYTAKKLDCPYVLGSQITFANGRWQTKNSRHFEERAAMVLRVERERDDRGRLSNNGKIVVVKNRFGIEGMLPLTIDPRYQRYEIADQT